MMKQYLFNLSLFLILGSCQNTKKLSPYSAEVLGRMKKHNCIPNQNWYKESVSDKQNENDIGKPYLKEVREDVSGVIFFFWCTVKDGVNKLVFDKSLIHKENRFRSCPTLIIETSSSPQSLSSLQPREGETNGFWRRDNNQKVIYLKKISKNSLGVLSSFDGSGTEFFCQNGYWWRKSFH